MYKFVNEIIAKRQGKSSKLHTATKESPRSMGIDRAEISELKAEKAAFRAVTV